MGELIGELADEVDKGRVVGDENTEAVELLPAVGNGVLDPPRRLLGLLGGKEGVDGGDGALRSVSHQENRAGPDGREARAFAEPEV